MRLMWKVSNFKNEAKLKLFQDNICSPFLSTLVEYATKKQLFQSFENYLDQQHSKKNYYNVLKYVINLKLNKIYIKFYLEELVNTKKVKYLRKQFEIFKKQNTQLDNFDFNLVKENIDPILKDIFIELFYQKLFDSAKIWGIIDSHSTTFSRQIFHENFKRENNIYICPYCDTDTIISDGNIVIEHFIPKSDYPFVCMHPNNLMSSCYGCNGIYGKHTKYYAPIYSPYNVQIGELIKFGIDFSEKKVTLDGAGELKVDNYIKTLRLEPKYSKRDVFDLVYSNSNFIFGLITKDKKQEIGTDLLKKYLQVKKNPLTFLTLSVFNDVCKYESNE